MYAHCPSVDMLSIFTFIKAEVGLYFYVFTLTLLSQSTFKLIDPYDEFAHALSVLACSNFLHENVASDFLKIVPFLYFFTCN